MATSIPRTRRRLLNPKIFFLQGSRKICLFLGISAAAIAYALFEHLSRPWDLDCPPGKYVVPTIGTFEIPPPVPMHGYTFRHMCRGEIWEPHVVSAVRQYLHGQGSAIEVGSHVGMLTLPIARAAAPHPVYTFEVNRANYRALRRNLVLNNVRNVRPHNSPISSDALSSDDVDLSDLALIKLDCEGCEPAALDVLKPAMQMWGPVVLIEMQPQWRAEIEKKLKDLKYDCSLIGDSVWDYVCISQANAPPEQHPRVEAANATKTLRGQRL